MSLCMPGVLAVGGARGRDDDRACRRPCCDGASLRGSRGVASDCILAPSVVEWYRFGDGEPVVRGSLDASNSRSKCVH